jgi:hypothetical protein
MEPDLTAVLGSPHETSVLRGRNLSRPVGPKRRSRRSLWWAAGSVAATLVVIGTATGGGQEDSTTGVADRTTAVATPSTTVPAPPLVRESAVVAQELPTPRVREQPTPPPTTRPTTRTTPQATTRRPAPAPAAAPAASGCHPSYTPCVPDGPDLDCGQIKKQVTVVGPDEYRLDENGDGKGCESYA